MKIDLSVFKATYKGMNYTNKVLMALVCIAPFIAMYSSWWLVLASIVVWQFMAYFGVSVGAHRYFTHAAFECNRFWQWVMAITGVVSMIGPPCVWADVHAKHHKHSDTDQDPYIQFVKSGTSPFDKRDMVGNRFMLKLLKDKLHKSTLMHYWLYVLSYIGVVIGAAFAFGQSPIEWVFWLWAIPAGMTNLVLRFVLWAQHIEWIGYRNYDTKDKSNNWWFISLIAAGEGWHNNHHQDQRNPNMRHKWWEIDPGFWIIKLIRKKK